jgi:acetyl-CoA carboxylase biotin carboxylase subunit
VKESDVPVVPGSTERIVDADHAGRLAAETGYPILLKAVAGGGGKGMRRVESPEEVAGAFRQASSEALKAFGNGDMYVERCIDRPRHVEIQILGDRFGNVVHFGERECSIQRRHQKLIEESPSPAVDEGLRGQMGDAAVRAARAVQYEGAGTVEFLLDADGRFHFLEMNTRIQVEHPITELVYGVDLVRQQLRIASGHSLEHDVFASGPTGHAIECRITSEDPYNAFLPDTGTVESLSIPSGPGVRWDGGIATGNAIGLHYDPLLAKLIVWGATRAEAIARMRRALDELVVVGVSTSQPFHSLVLAHEAFASGQYDTGYLDLHLDALLSAGEKRDRLDVVVMAAVLAEHQRRQAAVPTRAAPSGGESDWLRAARRDGLR